MKHALYALLAALSLIAQPLLASADKPLVIVAGQTRQLPSGDTLQVNASASGGASINIPHGSAPSAPVNGDVWTTTAGIYVRVNGSTIGPLTTVSGGGGLLASNNLSDVNSAGTSRSNLGLAIGSNVQAYDADLTTYAGITPSANVQSLLGAADYAAIRSQLSLGTFATQNYATPPAIGGTTPAAGSFTTLSATSTLTTAVTGSTQCLHVDSSGVVSGTGSDCGSGGSLTDGDKGDITVSSSGSAWAIDSAAVSLSKIANASASSKLLGSGSSGSGASYSEITLGSGLSMTSTTLSVPGIYEPRPTSIPDLSAFTTWRNQGSATITADSYGVYFVGDNDSELHIYEQAMPATPFSYYARVRHQTYSTTAATTQLFNQVGFAVIDSTNGRVLTFEIGWERISGDENNDYYYQIERFSSVTVQNASVSVWRMVVPPNWIRVDVTSTGVTLFGSVDGRRWASLGSELFATYLTASGGGSADKFGIYQRSGSNATTSYFLFDVLQTTAP